jgi:WXG100 family type VII secretion target
VSRNELDPVELERIARVFEEQRGAIGSALGEFAEQVNHIRAKWDGKAALGFQNAAAAYEDRQGNLVRVLTESAESLRAHAGASRRATEEAAAAVSLQMPLEN